MVERLEPVPGVDLAVCVGTGTETAASNEHVQSHREPECGGHDPPHPRRPIVDYTHEEVEDFLYIMDGVRKFGTSWTTILQNYAFNSQWTAADMKDTYASIKQVCQIDYEYVDYQTSCKRFMHQAGLSAQV